MPLSLRENGANSIGLLCTLARNAIALCLLSLTIRAVYGQSALLPKNEAAATLASVTTGSSNSSSVSYSNILLSQGGPSSLPDAPGFPASDVEDRQAATDSQAVQEGHSTTSAPQQTKRILGIMPNFNAVTADTKLPPLSVKDKFILAGRNSFDYSSFILTGIQSGVSLAGNSYPQFGEGAVGYGRYYWHTLLDTADENFMVSGTFPVIFRQDPRFYTLGHGGFVKRAAYASTRIFVSRTDNGHAMPNLSEAFGAGAAAGVSSLYYPGQYRTWTKVGQKWLTSVVIDGLGFTFKEFWPDINHKIFHTH